MKLELGTALHAGLHAGEGQRRVNCRDDRWPTPVLPRGRFPVLCFCSKRSLSPEEIRELEQAVEASRGAAKHKVEASHRVDSGQGPERQVARGRQIPRPLPNDIYETVVNALVEALVQDYQQDPGDMVNSPPGKDHDIEGGRS